jgi:D-beta-D-heptose 7-phosphate kinase/D-beta-D-heptose 1-phosphate adenosyltransferase
MVDRFIYGDAERLSPEAPVPVVRLRRRTSQPGGAANVASNVTSLGGQVSVFGAVGDDPAGDEIRAMLEAQGADLSGVVSPSGYPTIIKTRVIARGQQMLRIDEEEPGLLSRDAQGEVAKRLSGMIGDIDAVVISDYAKGLITLDMALHVVTICNDAGVPVLVDPKPTNAAMFAGADLIKPNLGEAIQIAGRDNREAQLDMPGLCKAVHDASGVQSVIVTAGSQGMHVLSSGVYSYLPGQTREVYDVAGAGDSTLAAIALGMAAGLSVLEAAWLGNLAGSLAVGHQGVASIRAEELLEEVARKHESALP